MREFTVNQNDTGQRLDKFITKAVPKLPASLLYKYIRIKRIKVNGKRADERQKLNLGDLIQLYVNDEFFEQNDSPLDFMNTTDDVRVVYEDENILVADKPAGLLCHSDENESRHTLINKILLYLYHQNSYLPENENSFTPALCNRIDRNTSGLVIAAKNAEALRIMSEKIKLREVKKFYKCVVFGKFPVPSGEIRSYLTKDGNNNMVSVSNKQKPGAVSAVSKYKVLKTTDELSLLEVELVTGRTHQIRAQFADANHPLLGDTKYGNAARSKPYGFNWQALCAYKIKFDFANDAGILQYLNQKIIELPPPEFELLLF
ncbi:MAG TPA: RluA family pseudouridine synthase [Clostridiales bacterium]|nr:RluA family pseudouridine synthase [Clostridiales bacterium]